MFFAYYADRLRTGSQSEWAPRTGVNRTYLNKVLKGIKPPSKL